MTKAKWIKVRDIKAGDGVATTSGASVVWCEVAGVSQDVYDGKPSRYWTIQFKRTGTFTVLGATKLEVVRA